MRARTLGPAFFFAEARLERFAGLLEREADDLPEFERELRVEVRDAMTIRVSADPAGAGHVAAERAVCRLALDDHGDDHRTSPVLRVDPAAQGAPDYLRERVLLGDSVAHGPKDLFFDHRHDLVEDSI